MEAFIEARKSARSKIAEWYDRCKYLFLKDWIDKRRSHSGIIFRSGSTPDVKGVITVLKAVEQGQFDLSTIGLEADPTNTAVREQLNAIEKRYLQAVDETKDCPSDLIAGVRGMAAVDQVPTKRELEETVMMLNLGSTCPVDQKTVFEPTFDALTRHISKDLMDTPDEFIELRPGMKELFEYWSCLRKLAHTTTTVDTINEYFEDVAYKGYLSIGISDTLKEVAIAIIRWLTKTGNRIEGLEDKLQTVMLVSVPDDRALTNEIRKYKTVKTPKRTGPIAVPTVAVQDQAATTYRSIVEALQLGNESAYVIVNNEKRLIDPTTYTFTFRGKPVVISPSSLHGKQLSGIIGRRISLF